MNLYMVDIDGTVVDARKRYKKAGPEPKGNKTSKTYQKWVKTVMDKKQLSKDPEIRGMSELLESLRHTGIVVFVTSREETHRPVTTKWLEKHFMYAPSDRLIMRPKGNLEADHALKERAIDAELQGQLSLDQVFILDDDLRGGLAEVAKRRGWVMLQVRGFSL